MQRQNMSYEAYAAAGVGSSRMFPEALSWPGQYHNGFNPLLENEPFLLPPSPPASNYGGFFNRSWFGACEGQSHLRLLSDAVFGQVLHQPYSGIHSELERQEIMDAKALAASKSHSEAERRRRERINNHLAKLRSLLPSTTKTDKASLLAEVIQHLKELKRQTSILEESILLPTEMDELMVDSIDADDEEGRFIIKASICCEDRSDLLADLIKTLKALRLRTLKAEITTLGGRAKNVLLITGDDHDDQDSIGYEQELPQQYSVSAIEEALRAVMDKTNGVESSPGSTVKRQRTNINVY